MIRHLGSLLSALAAGGCTLYQCRPDTPPPPPIHTDYSITRDVVFSPPGWPQSLKADIYQPNGTGPFPAVLVLYGGGWEHRDRKQLSSIAKDLARRGYVAVASTYRLAQIGRAHVCTPVTNAHLVCRLLRKTNKTLQTGRAHLIPPV